jgi:hypothetical protein
MPAKRPIAPANEAEAYELHLHLDNTERLYRQRLAIEDLLRRKALKGKYDGSLAPKAFMYVVDEGARHYRKENRMVGGFNPATRMLVAKDFTRRFEDEFAQLSHHAGNKRMANPAKRKASRSTYNVRLFDPEVGSFRHYATMRGTSVRDVARRFLAKWSTGDDASISEDDISVVKVAKRKARR